MIDLSNKERIKEMIQEFKEFIKRGNVLDLAVGVIMGGAFGKIVSSVVDDILMPIIGVLVGGVDFKNLKVTVGNATITYGNFLQNVIDFLIVALCIFLIIKLINKFFTLHKKEEEEKKEEPKKSDEVLLLEEIRDLLKDKESIKSKNKK